MEGRAVSTAEYAGRNIPTAPKPVNPSCFGNIEDVCNQSARVAAMVEKIVNRLCGHPPPNPPESGAIQGEPNGMLEAADCQARDIRTNLQRILDATDRLEKQLP